ncbi:MAG: DUF2007 domain-containing protein [Verrucomicrobiota bacterium JB023]|nr:DUF2007 domain-containing protein [Verrucomicrobiota bacterium JB023]
MIEIYRNANLARVGLLAERLKAEGIAVFLRNDHLSVSEAQIPSFYPAICVMNEADASTARKFLQVFLEEEKRPLGPDWQCSACGESVPDSMAVCWSCQAVRPTSAEEG